MQNCSLPHPSLHWTFIVLRNVCSSARAAQRKPLVRKLMSAHQPAAASGTPQGQPLLPQQLQATSASEQPQPLLTQQVAEAARVTGQPSAPIQNVADPNSKNQQKKRARLERAQAAKVQKKHAAKEKHQQESTARQEATKARLDAMTPEEREEWSKRRILVRQARMQESFRLTWRSD